MTVLTVPLLAAALLAFGGFVLLVFERKCPRAGRMFLGAVAACAVLGLAVTMVRSPNGPFASSAQATSRTMVD